ncbi:MAG TPA: permease-like cell division protein FtsX [Usitatibacter sp.]|nr:permease-like cell division protein FtsX [Usitatibacter sp.]
MHAHALADALRRVASQPSGALMSVLVLGLAVALPVVAAVALRSAGAAAASLDTEPHVNVYLALDATDADVRRVELALKAHPEAAAVSFIPREKALQELRATTHLAEILAALERNPLPHAFTVRVRTTDAARLESVRAAWSALPKVDQVGADFEWSQRLARWVRFGERALAALALLLGAAVSFIVGHLVRLQVLTRREEIEVSQLIGATAADVRRPFLYHGFLQGLAGGVAAVGLAFALWAWLAAELSALTPGYPSDMKLLFLRVDEMALVVLAAALLGLLGAWLAVGREIRHFSVG